MKHYPVTNCECGMVYNPKKNGVERSCPNPDCPTNHKPTKKAAKEPVNV